MSVTCGHPTLLAVYQRRLPAFVPSRCAQGRSSASITFRAPLLPSETSRRAGILSISSGTTTAPGAILLVLGSRDSELPSAPTAGTSRHSTTLLHAFQCSSPPYFTSGRRLPCSRNLIKLNYASALFAVGHPPANNKGGVQSFGAARTLSPYPLSGCRSEAILKSNQLYLRHLR